MAWWKLMDSGIIVCACVCVCVRVHERAHVHVRVWHQYPESDIDEEWGEEALPYNEIEMSPWRKQFMPGIALTTLFLLPVTHPARLWCWFDIIFVVGLKTKLRDTECISKPIWFPSPLCFDTICEGRKYNIWVAGTKHDLPHPLW